MQTILVNLYNFDPVHDGGTTRVVYELGRMLAGLARSRQARVIYAVGWRMAGRFSEWLSEPQVEILPCLPETNLSALIKAIPADLIISPLYWMFPFDPPLSEQSPAHVMLIADTIPLDHPELFSPADVQNSSRIYAWSRNAARVVTPSNHARDNLIERVGLNADQITVIPWAGELSADPLPTCPPLETLLPYILYPANALAHKRHHLLLRIMQEIWLEQPQYRLVLTGDHEAGFIENLCRQVGCDTKQIVDLGFVSDGQMVTLFQHAEAMIFPSLHEGFGLPILEAMGLGCPVICSRRTSIPEVAGDAAIFVDSDDPRLWAQAFLHSLPEKRDHLIAAGRKRANLFSWQKVRDGWLKALLDTGLVLAESEPFSDIPVPLSAVREEVSAWAVEHDRLNAELIEKEREIQKMAAAARTMSADLQAKEAVISEYNFILNPIHFLLDPLFRLARYSKKYISARLDLLPQYPPRPIKIPSWYSSQPVNSSTPTISIVTPSYNQSTYLEGTIQSVLGQNYPGLEYIIQDGNSTDQSQLLLEKYRGRLTYVESTDDNGQADAINRGFSHSSGELMAYLNSDDQLLPGALAYIADYFAKHANVDVIYGHRVMMNEHGEEIGRWVLPPHDDTILYWADFVPQETLFWRRRIWDRVGGRIDDSFHFAMDWDLLLRFQAAGAKIVRLPRFLGAFRVHDQQKSLLEMNDSGAIEMKRLREQYLQRPVTWQEINQHVRRYRLKAGIARLLYRMRLARY